jgi:hypothetical protein
MISIEFRSGLVVELHKGARFDTSKIGEADVVSLQADGHELEWIKENFSGLPMHNFRVACWFGDDAKFIYTALFYL